MGYHDFDSPGLRMDIAVGTGFVVETGVFCAYTRLFIAVLPVLTSARRLKDARSARSAWVFLIFSILMYVVATLHLIFDALRFYKGIFQTIDSNSRIQYLQDFRYWEFRGLIMLVFIQTWLGDALVIYRCYYIWDNNLWLISVPVCLLLGTIGVDCYVLYWIIYPVINLVSFGLARSNFMTTSLIILKILLQHHESKKAGIVNVGSKLGLIRLVRIVIESAAIYTVQLLVLNILSFGDDTFQYVIQAAIISSIGITFLLLAIRIKASHKTTTKSNLGIRSSMVPRWLRQPDGDIGSEDREDGSSPPVEGNPGLSEKSAVEEEIGVESINWDSGLSSSSGKTADKLSFIVEEKSS